MNCVKIDYWIRDLEKQYDQHYCTLDHKDCYELAQILREFRESREEEKGEDINE